MQRGSYLTVAARSGRDFVLGVILLYGYVYTAYKYGNPFFGRNDFFRYETMVAHPFDLSATPAPFVLRQIPAIVASVFYRLGFHGDTAAVIDTLGLDGETKRRFFAMILSNALAVCLSFTILSGYLRTKLATDGLISSLALFGILAAWFYFPSAVIAPVTIGWGWLASSFLVVAFVEASAAMTVLACALALFSRETTLIFGLTMFVASLLFERDRRRGVGVSVIVLAVSCLLYLALRIGLTTGYEHQINPAGIAGRIASLSFPAHFFVQLILAQGILILLLVLIAAKLARYAVYLAAAAGVMALVAVATGVTDVGLLVGETLPFYAVIFILVWNGALPVPPAGKSVIRADASRLD
jgi:hypothetical protein